MNPNTGSKSRESCRPCPAGTTSTVAGVATCIPCPAGQYSASTTECLPCKPTMRSRAGFGECLPCPGTRGDNVCSGHGTCTAQPLPPPEYIHDLPNNRTAAFCECTALYGGSDCSVRDFVPVSEVNAGDVVVAGGQLLQANRSGLFASVDGVAWHPLPYPENFDVQDSHRLMAWKSYVFIIQNSASDPASSWWINMSEPVTTQCCTSMSASLLELSALRTASILSNAVSDVMKSCFAYASV